jgi:hypothetical protein
MGVVWEFGVGLGRSGEGWEKKGLGGGLNPESIVLPRASKIGGLERKK